MEVKIVLANLFVSTFVELCKDIICVCHKLTNSLQFMYIAKHAIQSSGRRYRISQVFLPFQNCSFVGDAHDRYRVGFVPSEPAKLEFFYLNTFSSLIDWSETGHWHLDNH